MYIFKETEQSFAMKVPFLLSPRNSFYFCLVRSPVFGAAPSKMEKKNQTSSDQESVFINAFVRLEVD